MPDILLCAINAKWVHPSLALRLLKANLGPLEDRAEILEFALRQPAEDKVEAILAARPRVLALSVSIWNHVQTLELLRELSAHWGAAGSGVPRPAVVLGGPEASYLPDGAPLLAACDWLVRGEGEHAFRGLCEALLEGRALGPSAAAPRVYRAAAGCMVAEALPVDPASIDPGYRLYTEEDLERKLTYVEASRGCPFGCEFCLSSLDRRVRWFPEDAFLANMEALAARGARAFKFLDRSFNLDEARAGRIMDFFLERARPGLYVHFEMVPTRFPPALRERLERFAAGSLRLEVGIQTFDPETARAIGRASDPEKEIEALRFLRERTAAVVHADLIAGLPGESFRSFAAGFDLLWTARPGEIQLGVLKRLPGAPLARHDAAFAMEYAAEPPYEVLSTSAMTRADLDRLKNFARFWELVVNRGHFDDLVPRLVPEGPGAFDRFLAISDRLLERFGRNWGIDRALLRAALEEEAGQPA